MANYKAVMRPALECAFSIWSPFASSTSINKLQVMENAALKTATRCTQDTNIQDLHHETLALPIHEHLHTAPRLTIQTENTTSITSLTQTNNILQHSKAKKHIHYTINIPTHTVTTTDIKTNMHHIHTFIVSRHISGSLYGTIIKRVACILFFFTLHTCSLILLIHWLCSLYFILLEYTCFPWIKSPSEWCWMCHNYQVYTTQIRQCCEG